MSDKGKSSFDPDATLQPGEKRFDPDATLQPGEKRFDPDATVAPATAKFDPDITVTSPQEMFDPDATVGIGGKRRRRANPFAPKALPEALQANLAALGGINPLVAFANPIFGVVPEVRAARTHPDPNQLKETLQDLIEAFEAGASAAGMAQDTVEAAVYALCCLADDAAAATPWGGDWPQDGLLHRMRDETRGDTEFFALLAEMSADPARNADLLEFLYICLALGFEGRYRESTGGRAELERVRSELHALVVRRRPRPDALSERWRGLSAAPRRQPAPDAGRSPWRTVATAVTALVILVLAYAFMRAPVPEKSAVVEQHPAPPAEATAATPAPAPAAAPASTATAAPAVLAPVTTPAAPTAAVRQALEAAIGSGLIAVAEDPGGITISIRDDRQFSPAGTHPDEKMLPALEHVAASLDGVAGSIVVIGHASAVPVNTKLFASNDALSLARARVVARLLRAKLREPARVTAEGAGDREQIAPNDTAQNTARNRRVVIRVRPGAASKGSGS